MSAIPDASLVELRRLTFGYGERVVLDDISLTVPRGKVTALMGASGGGKTTIAGVAATRAQIEAACGRAVLDKNTPIETMGQSAPRASGTLESHYAPRAKVRLMSAQDMARKLEALGPHANNLGLWSVERPNAGAGVLWREQPASANQAAHALFSVLRDLDARGVQQIWVQLPPDTPEWEGVRDRLQRAAA